MQAAFSGKDGAYLAAADMSGVIKVWKVAAREVVWEFETSDITVRKFEPWGENCLSFKLCLFAVHVLAPVVQHSLRHDRRLGAVDVEDTVGREQDLCRYNTYLICTELVHFAIFVNVLNLIIRPTHVSNQSDSSSCR